MLLLKCCTQYTSQIGKLSSGHRAGKGHFSFQSQRMAMPKNVQTSKQLCSFQMLIRCVHVYSAMFDSLWPHGLKPARLPCLRKFPGKNTRVGCHFLLQEIFLTQGWNLYFLLSRQILYHWSTWKAQLPVYTLLIGDQKYYFHSKRQIKFFHPFGVFLKILKNFWKTSGELTSLFPPSYALDLRGGYS